MYARMLKKSSDGLVWININSDYKIYSQNTLTSAEIIGTWFRAKGLLQL